MHDEEVHVGFPLTFGHEQGRKNSQIPNNDKQQ